MGTIIDQLLAQKKPWLADAQKSGIVFELSLESGDKEAFEFLAPRYFDADLLWSNMEYQGEDDEDNFPHIYKIDASALLLAFFCSDGGLSSLANGDLKRQIGEATAKAFNSEHTALDDIRCSEDPELQGDDDQDDTLTGEYEAVESQDLGSGDDWGVDTEATEGD